MNKLFFIAILLLATSLNSQAQNFSLQDLTNWWGGKTISKGDVVNPVEKVDTPKTAVTEVTEVTSLAAGARLESGQELKTANGAYKLIMQTDANLCIYTKDNRPTWCTMTNGNGAGCYLIMQTDGNLVVYNRSNRAIWASNTWELRDKPVKMTLENDGSIHLRTANNTSVWSKK
ncbi:MAG: hypothetical protein GY810_05490 [Aureispira sp.]|nr:hypothetical protein [Aureispira sp.]